MEPIVLGIDLATANARVLAVGVDTGRTLAQAQSPLSPPVRAANGRSEQLANYADVVVELIEAVATELGAYSKAIQALCITGTSGTVVPCDNQGRPVGNALMYDDQRASIENAQIQANSPAGPYAALARIAWLNRNEPAQKYLNTPDVVHAALAKQVLPSDTSHSLKSAIDMVAGAWDTRLLGVLELPLEKLGCLVPSGAILGEVASAQAADLGLPAGVRIIAGMTDGCTAQIGAGAVQEGDVVGVLGTTLVLKSVAATNICSDDFVVYSHRGPDGSFWPGGASNVGAAALTSRFGTSEQSIRDGNTMAERHGVATKVCYPLTGVGERFPFTSATAKFFSVGGAETDAENYRAIMEGVAFTERLGVERLMSLGVVPKRFLATGGGSSSRVWNTIRATALGRPLHRTHSHNSAYGAAMIAAAALTGEQLAQVSDRVVSVEESFDPDPRQSEGLERNYQIFVSELRRRGYLSHEG